MLAEARPGQKAETLPSRLLGASEGCNGAWSAMPVSGDILLMAFRILSLNAMVITCFLSRLSCLARNGRI